MSMGERLRIEVDRAACMGSGNCAFHAPKTFDVDDDMKAFVLDPEGDDVAKVRVAVDGCPTQALRLVE